MTYGYPHRDDCDSVHAEQELWRRADALYDRYREVSPVAAVDLDSDTAPIDLDTLMQEQHTVDLQGDEELSPLAIKPHTLDYYLRQEAQRLVRRHPAEQARLVGDARDFGRWSADEAREPNVRVRARFAVQMAYDLTRRVIVRTHLSESIPTRWSWRWQRGGTPRQVHYPTYSDYAPPIVSEDIPRLRGAENRLEDEELLVEPSWTKTYTYRYAIDPCRPPLAAMLIASRVLLRWLPRSGARVVCVAPGRGAAAQALSLWMRRHVIYTSLSELHPEQVPGLDQNQADAVIINVPAARQLNYLKVMSDPDRWVDRRVHDQLWRGPIDDPLGHVQGFVEAGLEYLAPGGILITVGAVEGGLHLQANKLIQRRAHHVVPEPIEFDAETIDTVTKGIWVDYPKRPWCPWGCLPPSGRLLSIWRAKS